MSLCFSFQRLVSTGYSFKDDRYDSVMEKATKVFAKNAQPTPKNNRHADHLVITSRSFMLLHPYRFLPKDNIYSYSSFVLVHDVRE